MHRKLFLGLVILASALLVAQEALTNESVLKLCKAGISDDAIIGMMNSQPTKFSLSSDDVVALKTGGASDKVIAAMIARGSGEPARKVVVAQPEAPTTAKDGTPLPDELGVYYVKDGKLVTVSPEILNLRTARGAQFAIGIMAAAKLNGWVTNQHSPNHVAPDVNFIVRLAEGTDPAEYVCLKLEVKKDRREVELARGRINFSTGTQRAAIPFTSEKLAKQVYKIKFGAFRQGEYCLMPPGANISANATSVGKVYTFLVE